MPVELVTVPNVELCMVGDDWQASTGPVTITAEDLVAAVAAQDDPGLRTPVLKLGHVDPRFDGQPSIGRVCNLRTDGTGQVLLGDLVGVPAWIAEIIPSAWPSRSVEFCSNYQTGTGRTHDMALLGLALLGVQAPAIEGLADVAALYQVQAASAAAGQEVSVTLPGAALAVATEDVRRAYYDSLPGTQAYWWIRCMYLDPPELIVDDNNDHLYRVPYTVAADGTVTFGDSQEVVIEYVNAPANASRRPSTVYGSLAASRPGAAAADSSKPYGDVKYADPGYQSDKKKRYPLDTAEHVKAAWSYINQAGNASKYTLAQLKRIKGRIKAAAKKFGIKISDSASASRAGQTRRVSMAFDANAALREMLGLDPDAPDSDVETAFEQREDDTPDEDVTGTGSEDDTGDDSSTVDGGQPDGNGDTATGAPAVPEGAVLVDASAWRTVQDQARQGAAAAARQTKEDREAFLAQAKRDGRITQASEANWRAQLELGGQAEKLARQTIASFPKNTAVPVSELGHGGTGEDQDTGSAYPEGWLTPIERQRVLSARGQNGN